MYTEKNIEYSDGQTTFKGYYAYQNETQAKKRPAVLIVHDYAGFGEFTQNKAKKLADLGYVGFAVDVYGEGKSAKNKEEAMQLMTALLNDRALLQKRILAAFENVKKIPTVDAQKIAAMGFCFGGLVSLDLARSGADLKGAVSFHGNLSPSHLASQKIKAKILVLHGFKDPYVPAENVIAFADEMMDANADWEIDMYGNALHSFTKPSANDKSAGMAYDQQADARAWIAMKNFFAEIFAR